MGIRPAHTRWLDALARLLLASGLCTACGSDSGSPLILLGTGERSFVDIGQSGGVQIIHGPQGGHHIWASVLVRDAPLENVALRFTLRSADSGAVVSTRSMTTDLEALAASMLPAGQANPCTSATNPKRSEPFCLPGTVDRWGALLGVPVYVANELTSTVANTALTMGVTGTDASGTRHFSAERTFFALPP